MKHLAPLIAGLLFGAGLVISGMVNPMKVVNFLDLSGNWDPTLIFVMAGGLLVTFIGYRIVFARSQPVFAPNFVLPQTSGIDGRLIGGAVMFGMGWGLTGYCPGPAVASLVFGQWPSVLFVIAMAAGILLTRLIPRRPASVPQTTSVED